MAAIFLFFFTSAPIYCIFSLICLKRFIFLLSDGESYLLFRYIWFTYVFSTDKGSFSSFITKAPNMLKNHSPRRPLCRPKPVKGTPNKFSVVFYVTKNILLVQFVKKYCAKNERHNEAHQQMVSKVSTVEPLIAANFTAKVRWPLFGSGRYSEVYYNMGKRLGLKVSGRYRGGGRYSEVAAIRGSTV